MKAISTALAPGKAVWREISELGWPSWFAGAFPFPAKHTCPVPEPPKFAELLRLNVRPDLQPANRQSWERDKDAPTLPSDREWFDDVLMAVRTATLVGKRVQLRTDGGILVLEVEK